jgi:methylated-DNA-[protein]-cysteine S-methyltransferase
MQYRISTPIGPVSITRNEAGALTSLRFVDSAARQLPELPAEDEVRRQLDAYFSGELRTFTLELAPPGTPFQQRVWAALCQIPWGQTWTYGQLAACLDQPSASRAVGGANGRNPIAIIIPCHRVVATNGLGGYTGGLHIKRALLAREGVEVDGALFPDAPAIYSAASAASSPAPAR